LPAQQDFEPAGTHSTELKQPFVAVSTLAVHMRLIDALQSGVLPEQMAISRTSVSRASLMLVD